MYACGQRTGDPITSSIYHHILNSDAVRRCSLSFYTSMGSVWQGGGYGSVWIVFCAKGDVVLLLESTP